MRGTEKPEVDHKAVPFPSSNEWFAQEKVFKKIKGSEESKSLEKEVFLH